MDSIPWPVDMRGWEKVGEIEAEEDTNWRKGLEVWAKGAQRRLIEPNGPVVLEYDKWTVMVQEEK